MMVRCSVAAVLMFAVISGCARESIPIYPEMDEAASLRILAGRAKHVQTLSAECLITLTRPNGESVRLDGAIAMKLPSHVRLRAWKFGRAVFDLTVTPDGIWLVSPDDPQRKEQITSAGLSAAKLAKTWSILIGGFFEEQTLQIQGAGPRLFFRREVPGEAVVVCEVDRATLTPRHYRLLDEAGITRFSLALEQYRQFDQIVWPTRLFAKSEGGSVEIQLRNIEINPELPDAAFVPPKRAEKLP